MSSISEVPVPQYAVIDNATRVIMALTTDSAYRPAANQSLVLLSKTITLNGYSVLNLDLTVSPATAQQISDSRVDPAVQATLDAQNVQALKGKASAAIADPAVPSTLKDFLSQYLLLM